MCKAYHNPPLDSIRLAHTATSCWAHFLSLKPLHHMIYMPTWKVRERKRFSEWAAIEQWKYLESWLHLPCPHRGHHVEHPRTACWQIEHENTYSLHFGQTPQPFVTGSIQLPHKGANDTAGATSPEFETTSLQLLLFTSLEIVMS